MPISTLFTDPSAFLSKLGDDQVVVTNPRKKLRPDFTGEFSDVDLFMMGVGGSSTAVSQLYDFNAVARFDSLKLKRLSNEYLNRISLAYRTYLPQDRDRFFEELSKIKRDAAEDGLMLSPQSIRLLIHDMPRDRKLRIIRRMNRQLRPELLELSRGMQ